MIAGRGLNSTLAVTVAAAEKDSSAGESLARVLVVDDEDAVLVTLQAVLQRQGYEVDAVGTSQAALEALERNTFDLVVTDLRLDGEEAGLEILRAAHERDMDTATILLTGYVSTESAIQAIKLGAINYLTKPCNIEELKVTVARGLQNRLVMLALKRRAEQAERANAEAEAARLELQQTKLFRQVERDHLHDLFQQAPALIAMTRGPDHIIELANPLFVALLGQSDVIGKPVRLAFPDLARQEFVKRFDEVFVSGETFVGVEMPLEQGDRGAGAANEIRHLTLVYQPINGAEEAVDSIFLLAVDVTEQVTARTLLEKLGPAVSGRGLPTNEPSRWALT